jgi:hypothetical protein
LRIAAARADKKANGEPAKPEEQILDGMGGHRQRIQIMDKLEEINGPVPWPLQLSIGRSGPAAGSKGHYRSRIKRIK